MKNNQFQSLPFPYFCVDEELMIITTSLSDYQEHHLKFTEFLAEEHRDDFIDFIYHTPEEESGIFEMKLHEEAACPYRIYKQKNNGKSFHLFCHPLESPGKETFEKMNTMRQKLLHSQLEILANQKDFEKMRKELDEKAFQSSYFANIGNLAAGIAHEIRNPLTTVKGFIQLIKPYLREIEKEDYANIALDEINRANEIIYQFLNAAKPQPRHLKLIELNKLIKELYVLYEGEAHLQNIMMDISLSTEEPSIYMDENQLKQVLINMVKNAIEAINIAERRQGEVVLSTEVNGDYALIIIKDNGCGMSAESIEKLFTPFYSTKMSGTGLGLAICKRIIDEHGGVIDIKSNLDEGTTFKIELPLYHQYMLHA